MLFEDLLLLLVIATAIFLFGVPLYQLVAKLFPHKRNALQEAKQRLEQARIDAEAARLNKEAEEIYEKLYEDVLHEDDETKQHRRI